MANYPQSTIYPEAPRPQQRPSGGRPRPHLDHPPPVLLVHPATSPQRIQNHNQHQHLPTAAAFHPAGPDRPGVPYPPANHQYGYQAHHQQQHHQNGYQAQQHVHQQQQQHGHHVHQHHHQQQYGGGATKTSQTPSPAAAVPLTPEPNLRPSRPVTPLDPPHLPVLEAPPGYPGTPTLDSSDAGQSFPTMTTLAGSSSCGTVVSPNASEAPRINFVSTTMSLWHEKQRFPFQRPINKFAVDDSGNGVYREAHFSTTSFLDYYSVLKSTHFLTLQEVERLLYRENEDFTTYVVKVTAADDSDFVILEEQYPTYGKMLDARYAIAEEIRVQLLSSFENNANGNRTPVLNTFGRRANNSPVKNTREAFNIGAASVCSDDDEV